MNAMKAIVGSVLLTFSLFAAPALAQQGAVVSQTEIDPARVSRIYMGQSRELIAVNQPADSAVRQAFEAEVIGRSPEQIKAHWSRLLFTGRAVELRDVASDEAVLEFVRSNPGTIGYISDASKASELHVILTFNAVP